MTRRRAERRGRLAELAAVLLLVAKGYRILARRYRTPVGEGREGGAYWPTHLMMN